MSASPVGGQLPSLEVQHKPHRALTTVEPGRRRCSEAQRECESGEGPATASEAQREPRRGVNIVASRSRRLRTRESGGEEGGGGGGSSEHPPGCAAVTRTRGRRGEGSPPWLPKGRREDRRSSQTASRASPPSRNQSAPPPPSLGHATALPEAPPAAAMREGTGRRALVAGG